MLMKVEFIEANELSEFHAEQAAHLAYLAFEDFYALFTFDYHKLISAIISQFRSYSELNQLVAAVEDNSIVGIGSYYSLSEMPMRQMEGLRSLLEISEDHLHSVKEVRRFSLNFAAPGSSGAYLARLAIPTHKQGAGLALNLLQQVESSILQRGFHQVRLHVKRDNLRALAFYAKAGYVPIDEENRSYILHNKEL